ncbi:hypothetical protein K488DRAFT_90251 [Vararia minispora EC-137]|uniref:Uncharacterized protein n=1 Tax=Vararia minispora EC-137 TaxID=1314806 RepID=A0ACB8Q8F0_9AGAM|nr:hypothetical protein K488DRAFT_90251 [Vararia minispora EC-137]
MSFDPKFIASVPEAPGLRWMNIPFDVTPAAKAAWAAALVYGINLVLGYLCLSYLFRKGLNGLRNRIVFALISIQLLLCTGHVVVLLVEVVVGNLLTFTFVTKNGYQFIKFLTNPAVVVLDSAQQVLATLTILLANFFLTWRLYEVWGKRALIALPTLMMLNFAELVLAVIVLLKVYSLNNIDTYWLRNTGWELLSYRVVTAATQLTVTGLLAWKSCESSSIALPVPRWSPEFRHWTAGSIVNVIIDSALVYPILLLLSVLPPMYSVTQQGLDILGGALGQIGLTVVLSLILRDRTEDEAPEYAEGPSAPGAEAQIDSSGRLAA